MVGQRATIFKSNKKVTLFVDEDPDRAENIHMGIPIKSVKDIADSIIDRLAKKNINFFLNPQ